MLCVLLAESDVLLERLVVLETTTSSKLLVPDVIEKFIFEGF